GLHAVGRDRLAVRVQVDETGSHHEPGRVDHPFGAAEPGSDSGDPPIHDCHIANGVHPARGVHHPADSDYQAAHIVIPHAKASDPARASSSAAGTWSAHAPAVSA